MSLRIIKAGVYDSLQDLGRSGYQHLGVSQGGVMDCFATKALNLLLGNNSNDTVIEMSFPAASIVFDKPVVFAVGGADFSATINGLPVPVMCPVMAGEKSSLQFCGNKNGGWAYLAIRGGLQGSPWLGSCSTNARVAMGGWQGRLLKKNDNIPYASQELPNNFPGKKNHIILPWYSTLWKDQSADDEIYVLPGREWKRLNSFNKTVFTEGEFRVSPSSDRMGYILDGPPVDIELKEEMISTPVQFGTIQLLPGGQMIILMADRQTIGGYPRIGHVISAHLPKIAQAKSQRIRFTIVNMETAEHLLLAQERHLLQLKNACIFKWESIFENERKPG